MTAPDIIIIGAGGAGLMCALTAGQRGRNVLIIDHSEKIGEKIRISGGGRCNFTNLHTTPDNFLSRNPHFCVSALSRFGPADFIRMVEANDISYHEKTLGQLFCDTSSNDILSMLVLACEEAGVIFLTGTRIDEIQKNENGFLLRTAKDGKRETFNSKSLVIATGGKSIPKIGATDYGYRIAEQFGLEIIEPNPGLVPFVFGNEFLSKYAELSGVSLLATVTCSGVVFTEAWLFTHRGLSGPAILQASSYWRNNDPISINLLPERDAFEELKDMKIQQPKLSVPNALAELLPRRLALCITGEMGIDGRLADTPDSELRRLSDHLHCWQISPTGTEGYRTAEVTVGGVDTKHLSSKTMECRNVPGLYFIGEVVDVTGQLGGFNFQWAWASGHAAGLSA